MIVSENLLLWWSHNQEITIRLLLETRRVADESWNQGWGEYYSGTRLAQNDKHEYTENIVLEYYSSTDFPVLVRSVLAPALPGTMAVMACAELWFVFLFFYTPEQHEFQWDLDYGLTNPLWIGSSMQSYIDQNMKSCKSDLARKVLMNTSPQTTGDGPQLP